jgi:CheY-like chemotaxis protein
MTASQAADMARILIAEDEETLRNLLRRALVEVGHSVLTAADGAEALDILTRESGDFDLLLTDIKMPVMDGIALALAAARDFPDVVILLMTGYADQRERANGLDALIHGVVTKPFSLADIKFEVASALASRMRTTARQSG